MPAMAHTTPHTPPPTRCFSFSRNANYTQTLTPTHPCIQNCTHAPTRTHACTHPRARAHTHKHTQTHTQARGLKKNGTKQQLITRLLASTADALASSIHGYLCLLTPPSLPPSLLHTLTHRAHNRYRMWNFGRRARRWKPSSMPRVSAAAPVFVCLVLYACVRPSVRLSLSLSLSLSLCVCVW